jgi:effector-binding domain-containing protein
MEIHTITVPPVPVIFFTTRATIPELSMFAGEVARKLYAEAARQNLLPTGPLHWVYYGMDGKPDTVFTLEIALPIDGSAYEESLFLHKELPPFTCISATHYGKWDNMHHTYGKLISAIESGSKKMYGICRELYLHMDFKNPENDVTVVQIGVE